MHKVIVDFIDLQDNNHAYKVGDIFPHDGVSVSEERIAKLASCKNRRKMPLIKEVGEDKAEDAVVIDEEAEDIVAVDEEVDSEVEFMNLPVESDEE